MCGVELQGCYKGTVFVHFLHVGVYDVWLRFVLEMLKARYLPEVTHLFVQKLE